MGMMRQFKKVLLYIVFISTFLLQAQVVQAGMVTDYADDIDYTEIQNVIDDVLDSNRINFKEYVGDMVNQKGYSPSNIFTSIKDGIVNEFKANLNTLIKLITIAIIAAIFTNFSSVFIDNQVAETGFYITYILLFTMLIATFQTASNLAADTIHEIVQFMKALIPAYFLSVAFSVGTTTSVVFYEATLITIGLVEYILVKFILPFINIYLIIMLVNNLTKEDRLSKMAETIATIIKWIIRSVMIFIIGLNTIQSLITPVADSVKKSFFIKIGRAIPGVGNLLSGAAETVLGAGVLLKNAIGVAGLVVIIIICAMPVLKLIIYVFIYKFGEAIVQPITDKRILNCLGACSEAVNLLLQLVFVVAILFMLTIAIVSASTM